jgi:hypothetical protein
MTPEEAQALQAHVDAIAAILYQNTAPEKLQSLEGIEQAVRQHMIEQVSPQIGIFLSKQVQQPQQVDLEGSKAALENYSSQKNKHSD